MIRTQNVRLQDVDKPIEVARLFNEVFDNLREIVALLPKEEKKASKRKDKT